MNNNNWEKQKTKHQTTTSALSQPEEEQQQHASRFIDKKGIVGSRKWWRWICYFGVCVCVIFIFFFFQSHGRPCPPLAFPIVSLCKGSGSYVRVISSTTTTTSRSSQMLKSLRQPSAERFFSAVYKHLFISDSRGYNKVETKKKTIRFASWVVDYIPRRGRRSNLNAIIELIYNTFFCAEWRNFVFF